jgi:Zinc knuckle
MRRTAKNFWEGAAQKIGNATNTTKGTVAIETVICDAKVTSTPANFTAATDATSGMEVAASNDSFQPVINVGNRNRNSEARHDGFDVQHEEGRNVNQSQGQVFNNGGRVGRNGQGFSESRGTDPVEGGGLDGLGRDHGNRNVPHPNIECYICKQKGHMAPRCPMAKCGGCGGFGHMVRFCPKVQCRKCGNWGHQQKMCDKKYIMCFNCLKRQGHTEHTCSFPDTGRVVFKRQG